MAVVVLQVGSVATVIDRVRGHLFPDIPVFGDELDLNLLEVVSHLFTLHLGLAHELEHEQNDPVLDFIYMDDLTELIHNILAHPLVRIALLYPVTRVEVHDRQGVLAFYH